MTQTPRTPPTLRGRLATHLGQAQHRNAYCLLLNNVLGAATGLLFLLLFTRVLARPPAEVGIGYAIVVLGTIVGVVAKGGLDTALLRTVPHATDLEARRIFRFALIVGGGIAVALALGLAAVSPWFGTQ